MNISFIRKIIIIVLLSVIIVLLMATRINNSKAAVFSETEVEEFIIRKGTNDKGKVVSFACYLDIGNDYMEDMLSMTDKYGVKITFFVSGDWAEEYPAVVSRLSSKGHEIGNGVFNKSYDNISYEDSEYEIKNCEHILRSLIKYDLNLLSPVSKTYNVDFIKASIESGYPGIVLGSIDMTNEESKDTIYENILNKITTNDIICIKPNKNSIEAMGLAIEKLLIDNYKIVTVSEMLRK